MSYIDHITEFLFDEHRRLSSKAAVVVFIILGIILIDNILGFSYSFSLERKIEQVQKLNSVLKDPTSDSITKAFAINLRTEIIEHKNVVAWVSSLFSSKSNSSVKPLPNNFSDSQLDKINPKKGFWFHLSTSALYYLFAIIMTPIIIFTDKKTSLLQRIATGIVATLLFIGIGWFFYWICGFIPQISKTTLIWNYIVNGIIQLALVTLIIKVSIDKAD